VRRAASRRARAGARGPASQPGRADPRHHGLAPAGRGDRRIVWGRFKNFFLPRDGGASVALPFEEDQPDGIEPAGALESIRVVGAWRIDIYARVARLFEANGWVRGDLDDPSREADFYVFPYDWRRSHVAAAAELARSLEHLRAVRGEAELRVDIVCQSNAATIARYFVKYGGEPLERAESGDAAPPPGIRVERLVMIGTANGGALGTLDDLHDGRRYVALIGRRFAPDTLRTFPSLFEALPAPRSDLFVDERGEPLALDLYDADDWHRYGLGSAEEPEARAFLTRALDVSRRLHAVLARDARGFAAERYYSIQNAYRPTADRAVLDRRGKRTKLYLPDDDPVREDPWLTALVAAPGDGHATLASQQALSPQENAALAAPTVFVDQSHREIMQSPAAHRHLLRFLRDREGDPLDR